MRRSSAAVGAVGIAGGGAAAAPRPVLPRPAVSRSSLTPSYEFFVTVPRNAGFTFEGGVNVSSPLQAASSSAVAIADARAPARLWHDMVVPPRKTYAALLRRGDSSAKAAR